MTEMPTIIALLLVVAFGSAIVSIASSLLGRQTYRRLVSLLDQVDRDPRTTDLDRQIVAGVSVPATNWLMGALALTAVVAMGLMLPAMTLLSGKKQKTRRQLPFSSIFPSLREAWATVAMPDDEKVRELSGVPLGDSWLRNTKELSDIWTLSWMSAAFAHPFWVIAIIVAYVTLWMPWLLFLWAAGQIFGLKSSFDPMAMLRSVAKPSH